MRNTKTGAVRAVIGQTYMLGEEEELWEKYLSPIVKTLLDKDRDPAADRGDYVNTHKQRRRETAMQQQSQMEIESKLFVETDSDGWNTILSNNE